MTLYWSNLGLPSFKLMHIQKMYWLHSQAMCTLPSSACVCWCLCMGGGGTSIINVCADVLWNASPPADYEKYE